VDVRLLGPLELRNDAGVIRLAGARPRALVAILALHANEPLSTERLVDALWGEHPPKAAANTVQVYVSRLRKLLPGALETQAAGYVLHVPPECIDVKRFERLVGESRSADRPEEASRLLAEALNLWRGPALAGIELEGFAVAEVRRLEETRLTALGDRIEADLACGRHAGLVGELEATVAAHPFQERLRGQLMIALYRSGRQADALEVYRATRELLVDELGIEPSPGLQELEQAILRQDTSLTAPARLPSEPQSAPLPDARKTVTVLAATFAVPADPEKAAAVLARASEAAAEILERHGASVEAHGGMRVLGIFGLPAVHEDDLLRAVRAALELRSEAPVRVGIEAGTVLAEAERVVAGAPVSDALRLAEGAAERQIVLGETAMGMAPPELRGRRRRSGGWLLTGVDPGAEAVPRHLDAPLVGRRDQLDELRRAYARVKRDRSAYLLTVLGPAGIGKSRLAAELRGEVEHEALVLAGRCLPYGEGITFWPVAEMVRQVGDVEEVVRGEPDGPLVAERVLGAVGRPEAAARSEEVFWAVRRLFEALARERPLVLVFDDLHWAEPTLLELVEHVAEWTRDARILLLCLARPELLDRAPAWGGGQLNAASLLLEPLSEGECVELVERLPQRARVRPDVRRRIVAASEGNPLFAEQMLAMAAERGEDEPLVIPPTIRAVLGARLDLLSGPEQRAVHVASVAGREFWSGAVAELLEIEREEVEHVLLPLVRKDLVRPARSVFPGEQAFQFRHLLIRDVAYQSIPKAARGPLHDRFADWLERTVRDADEVAAYHREQAARYHIELHGRDERGRELAARAAERLGVAGRQASRRGDVRAAASLLARAAELIEETDPARPELLTALAEAYRESGDFARADAALAEALAAAAAAGDEGVEHGARISRFLHARMTEPVRAGEIRPAVEAAVPVFERVGDQRRLALAWHLLGWLDWLVCRAEDASAKFERAAEHARLAGDEREETRNLHFLIGAALYGPAPVPVAIRRCEEVAHLLSGQPRLMAASLRARAALAAMDGRFEEAAELVERDKDLLADLGLRIAAASAADQYGLVRLLAGDPEGAEAEWRAGLDAFERMGEKSNASTLAAQIAEALYRQGRLEEALALTEQSARDAAPDDLHTQVQWRGPRAKVLALAGEPEDAERLAREAVELAERTDFLNMQAASLLDLAEVLRARRRRAEVGKLVDRAVALYEQKGNRVAAAQARGVRRRAAAAPSRR
jgi:DNA-binding SARP family transcriptional activator